MFVADHVSRFYEVYGNRVNLIPVFGIEVDQKEVKLSEEHCEFRKRLQKQKWQGRL